MQIHHSPTLSCDILPKTQTGLCQISGHLNWLSSGICINIFTITNMSANHQYSTTPSHVASAKHVVCYLQGSKSLGITFSSKSPPSASTFVNLPLHPHAVSLCNPNWDPKTLACQNQYTTHPPCPLQNPFCLWLPHLTWQANALAIKEPIHHHTQPC